MSKALLLSRKFLPLFMAQTSAIFVDNLYRNAFLLLIFYTATAGHFDTAVKYNYGLLSAAMLTLPFFIFSSLAGDLSDKLSKSRLIVFFKAAELGILIFGCYAVFAQSINLMLATIFLLGTHSAFLSPLKLSILPEYLKDSELLTANSYFEIGIFSAIIFGEVCATVLFANDQYGLYLLAGLILLISVGGFAASLYLPKTSPKNPGLNLNYNILMGNLDIIKKTRYRRVVYLCILGISWFWLVSSIIVNEIPILIKVSINAAPSVLTFVLVVFGIGISVGSLLCSRLLNDKIEATYVPLAAFGIAFVLYDLASVIHLSAKAESVLSLGAFLQSLTHLRIVFDFFCIGVLGGLYHVPLYTLMIHESDPAHRARTMACHNVISTAFMIAGSLLNFLLSKFFGGNPAYTLAFVSLIFAWLSLYISQIMPYGILQTILRFVFRTVYQARVVGLDHFFGARKEKLVIIANHTSWLDALLLASFLPERLTFALNSSMQQHWLIRFFIKLNKVYVVDHDQPMALRGLIERVKDGEKIVIFPENLPTVTGALMKIYESPALIAMKAGAKILPIYISGLQSSLFSRMKYKPTYSFFPRVSVHIHPATEIKISKTSNSRKDRHMAGDFLYQLMTSVCYEDHKFPGSLFDTLIHAVKTQSRGHRFNDITRKPMTYHQLLTRTFVLRYALSKVLRKVDQVGMLLPTAMPTVVSFFSLQSMGKVPVMLNYTQGIAQLLSCCETTSLSHVLTSRRFITKAKLEELEASLLEAGMKIIYLEDIASKISLKNKILGALSAMMPKLTMEYLKTNPDPSDTAVILFTSGSEGLPKGVALSHDNLHANISQLTSVIDLNRDDVVFNTLPLFHSFGLMGGLLLPALTGVKIFLYPNPLQYRIITELIYDTNATILFGTDYTLSLYANHASSYDFYSLRYVLAGAEKLKSSTFATWSEKFGIRIFEAYGLTEASPGLCSNTAMHCKRGTVGRFLPKIDYKLSSVEGLATGGRLWVKGPNIMKGYILHDKPNYIVKLKDGWHDTGDIVDIDDEGYVSILDRAKRFAKIAGEMVSLSAVEKVVSTAFPKHSHAVLSIPCPKKGEQLVLFTDDKTLDKKRLLSAFKKAMASDLWVPKTIHFAEIPRLPTGKINYQALQAILQASK